MQKFPIYASKEHLVADLASTEIKKSLPEIFGRLYTLARLLVWGFAAREERYDEQQNDSSHHRGYKRAEGPRRYPAHKPYEPATQESTDDTNNQINNKSRAAAPDDKVGQPSCDQANE